MGTRFRVTTSDGVVYDGYSWINAMGYFSQHADRGESATLEELRNGEWVATHVC